MQTLARSNRRQLLDLARAAVEATAGRSAKPGLDESVADPELLAPGAAFVTLREGGQLRGCIGMLRHDVPLWINVRDSAVAAARDDPRFPPVDASELPEIEIEVSVLEPPVALPDPSLFEAGRHGIVVERGACRALLLPQVATEMGWGESEMLEAVCRKAGLRPDAWRDRATRLYVFESVCFDAADC
ncbi:MAG: AmmeMemoRadiSam system protein A [Candidatus Limnocylindrales bacterium]|jgi:AmmeMemoRadiSam system protein A